MYCNYGVSDYIYKHKHINEVKYDSYEGLANQAKKYLVNSKHFYPKMLDNEDLIANLTVCIWCADATYSNDKNKDTESWRIDHCNWEIIRWIKQLDKCGQTDVNNPAIESNLLSDEDFAAEYAGQELFDRLLATKTLTAKERSVVYLRYAMSYTQVEISKKMGCTKQNVQEIDSKARKKLAKLYERRV